MSKRKHLSLVHKLKPSKKRITSISALTKRKKNKTPPTNVPGRYNLTTMGASKNSFDTDSDNELKIKKILI